MNEFMSDLKRLVWPLGMLGAGITYIRLLGSDLLRQQAGVFAWKVVLLGASVALAHYIRTQLFPYVDLSEVLKEKTVAGSIQLLAIALFMAAIIHALCAGL